MITLDESKNSIRLLFEKYIEKLTMNDKYL